jgi:hypothetical protein
LFGILLATFGIASRGSWSIQIASIGGIIWLAALVLVFWFVGWKLGVLTALGTFVLGNVSERVFRRVLRTSNRQSLWDIQRENERAEREMRELLRRGRK